MKDIHKLVSEVNLLEAMNPRDYAIASEKILSFLSKSNLGEHLLIHGDSLAVLKKFPDDSIDTAITSPPYWNVRKYTGESILGNESTPEDYVKNLVKIFDELKRVLRPEGSFWLNIGDRYKNRNLVGIPWRVAFAMQKKGWILRNDVIWDKGKGNPSSAKDRFRNMYEHVFHFVKNTKYYFNGNVVRGEPKHYILKNGKLITPTGVSGVNYRKQIKMNKTLTKKERQNALKALDEALKKVKIGEWADFRMIIRNQQRVTHSDSEDMSGRAKELQKKGYYILPYHPKGSMPSDVWQIIPEDEWRRDKHYAVFPLDLCERPIKATCPRGGVVLDPLVGTGTAILAAKKLGRIGIGIDISREYLDIAEKRVKTSLG